MRGGKPFWKKVLPPRAPPFQKLLPLGLCEDGRACEEEQAAPISEALYPGAWKSVPFEGRRRWRKGAKRNSWGEAGAIPGQPCQLVQTFRYVSRERWAPVLRIPCPFLGAVRLTDLPCALRVQLGDRRTVVVSDGSAHGGAGQAVRGAFS